MLYRVLALLLFAPIGVQAMECDAESPLKRSLGEQYYDLIDNPQNLTADNALVARVEQLLSDSRFRSGHATRITCKRIDGVIQPVKREFQLNQADTSVSLNGTVNLKLLMDDNNNRSRNLHTISFPGDIAWLPDNTKNALRMNHRYKNSGLSPTALLPAQQFKIVDGMQVDLRTTSSLVELDIKLTLVTGGVNVSQKIFTNGYFVEESNWVLLEK